MDHPSVKQPVSKHQVTIMDVCSGRLESINLKYIVSSDLEKIPVLILYQFIENQYQLNIDL